VKERRVGGVSGAANGVVKRDVIIKKNLEREKNNCLSGRKCSTGEDTVGEKIKFLIYKKGIARADFCVLKE